MNDTDLELLHIAAAQYRHPGAREAAFRRAAGASSARCWQIVNHLIDQPEALAAEPVIVGRLRRLRERRQAERRARRIGFKI